MLISVICPEEQIWEPLSGYLNGQKLSLIRIARDTQPQQLLQSDALLVHSPLFIANQFVQTEGLWRKYLINLNSRIKVISMGFRLAKDLNYIDLLNLPCYLTEFIAAARLPHLQESEINTFGLNLNNKLYRFFKGHDDKTADSIIAGLETIRSRMQSLFLQYQNRQNQPYLELLENILNFMDLEEDIRPASPTSPIAIWENFKNRWDHYFPLFEWTPFRPEFQTVDQLIDQCFPFFQSAWKDETKLNSTVGYLNQIYSILQRIEDDYAGLFPKK